MTIDVNLLQILVSMILPLVVGIVVKQVAHPAVRSVTLAFLSAVTAIAATGLGNNGEIGTATIAEAVVSFIIAVGTYYGLWKPTGIADNVNNTTKNFGITLTKQP